MFQWIGGGIQTCEWYAFFLISRMAVNVSDFLDRQVQSITEKCLSY